MQTGSGFTMVPHHTMGLLYSLPGSQSKILGFITRRTIGWRKPWDAISLSQFEHGVGSEPGTGLSRHTIIQAVRELEAKQLIRTMRLITEAGDSAVTAYALSEAALGTQSGTLHPELAAIAERVVKPLHDGGRAAIAPTRNKPDAKEKPSSISTVSSFGHDDDFLHVQNEFKPYSPSATVENAGLTFAAVDPAPDQVQPFEHPIPDAPAELTTTSTSEISRSIPPSAPERIMPPERSEQLSGSVFSIPPYITPPEPTSGLLESLLDLRFSRRVAADILTRYPAEEVRQALHFLPQRGARNPAAYLISELRAGDYAPPVSKNAPPRRAIGVPQPSPEAEARAEEAERESQRIEAAATEIDAETRAVLLQEARRRCAKIGFKNVPDDSLMLRMQFDILLKERVLDAESAPLQQCA
jgi:hypothetical protein